MTTYPFDMTSASDLEEQKDSQIYQMTAVVGNEHGQMTQDEATLYVAGTLQVRIGLFNSNLPSLLLFYFLIYPRPILYNYLQA